jgi:hypothetical protein
VGDAEERDVARPPRFSELLSEAAGLYWARFAALVPTFVVAYAVIVALPLLALIDLSDAALATLAFALQVMSALVGATLFASASIVYSDHIEGTRSSLRAALGSIRPLAREVITAALFSAIFSMFALTLLGSLGLLLQPLFVGPPILIQVVAIEHLRLREAWPRTRVIASGQWTRVVGMLLGIVIVLALVLIGVFGFVEAGTRAASDAARLGVFIAVQGLIAGLTYPYLAAAQFVLYRDLTARGAEAHAEE